MLFNTIIALAALATTTAHYSPNVYRCDGVNWQNNCYLITNPTDCHNRLGALGSYGPDKGLTCHMYTMADCHGDQASIQYPGTGSVSGFESRNRFYIRSWRCDRQ
jgi:hypothetical protein